MLSSFLALVLIHRFLQAKARAPQTAAALSPTARAATSLFGTHEEIKHRLSHSVSTNLNSLLLCPHAYGKWWRTRQDLNLQPFDPKSNALSN